MSGLEIITVLVFLAAAFTYINIHYLKLPSTIGLMMLALLMSITIVLVGNFVPALEMGARSIMRSFDFREVLLDVMLSFLLFAGALEIDLEKLANNKWPVIILATAGTLISTFAVGMMMFYVFGFLGLHVDLINCFLLGALISPTDPIAVLALVKKMGVTKDLEIKIAGESLFNDGVGVVVFLTILGVAQEGVESVHASHVLLEFFQEVGGGILLGIIFGYAGFQLLKYIDNDHVELEVLVTLSLVMAGTQLAGYIHISAPLAMVVMGLFLGHEGRAEHLANVTGEYVFKFWHLVDEALNAILFILIGLEMIIIYPKFSGTVFIAGTMAILVVLTARFIGVSIPIKIMEFKRSFSKGTIPILTWGGLRGGISVALALSLPEFPQKDILIAVTYSVVVFSILVQGLTMGRLVRKVVPTETI